MVFDFYFDGVTVKTGNCCYCLQQTRPNQNTLFARKFIGPGRILFSEIFKQSIRMTAIFVNFKNPNKPFSERKQTFLKQ